VLPSNEGALECSRQHPESPTTVSILFFPVIGAEWVQDWILQIAAVSRQKNMYRTAKDTTYLVVRKL